MFLTCSFMTILQNAKNQCRMSRGTTGTRALKKKSKETSLARLHGVFVRTTQLANKTNDGKEIKEKTRKTSKPETRPSLNRR